MAYPQYQPQPQQNNFAPQGNAMAGFPNTNNNMQFYLQQLQMAAQQGAGGLPFPQQQQPQQQAMNFGGQFAPQQMAGFGQQAPNVGNMASLPQQQPMMQFQPTQLQQQQATAQPAGGDTKSTGGASTGQAQPSVAPDGSNTTNAAAAGSVQSAAGVGGEAPEAALLLLRTNTQNPLILAEKILGPRPTSKEKSKLNAWNYQYKKMMKTGYEEVRMLMYGSASKFGRHTVNCRLSSFLAISLIFIYSCCSTSRFGRSCRTIAATRIVSVTSSLRRSSGSPRWERAWTPRTGRSTMTCCMISRRRRWRWRRRGRKSTRTRRFGSESAGSSRRCRSGPNLVSQTKGALPVRGIPPSSFLRDLHLLWLKVFLVETRNRRQRWWTRMPRMPPILPWRKLRPHWLPVAVLPRLRRGTMAEARNPRSASLPPDLHRGLNASQIRRK